MSVKLAANLNFLFKEAGSIAERMRSAYGAGFRAVEIPYITSELDDVIKVKKETGIEIVLMNIALGTSTDLQFGAASVPKAEQKFRAHLEETARQAKLLGCKKIHIMSGILQGDEANHHTTYGKNLKYSADYLKSQNLIGLIEPINKYSLPSYFMNSFKTAAQLIRNINSDNLRLMVDVFHLQLIRGNISHTFDEMKDIIGHIQIAQIPHRHEPNVPGELDFAYVFSVITKSGYTDWVGCEYTPKTTTLEGLTWISEFNTTF